MSDRAPNMKGELQAATNANPGLFEHAHREGDPKKHDWIKMAAWWLHSKVDARFGLNMKRDNDGQGISMDIITFRVGPTDRHVQVFDVCGKCGSAEQSVEWNDITDWSTLGNPGTARWVKPEPFGATGGGGAVAPAAHWTERHTAVVQALSAERGIILTTRLIAEQLGYDFPGENWGQKAADISRPISADTIARKVGGSLIGYRVLPWAGVAPTGPGDITGQAFYSRPPVNYLPEQAPPVEPQAPPNQPPPPAEPAPSAADLTPVLAAIGAQGALIAALHDEVVAVRAQLAKGFDIKASSKYLGGITGTVRPKEE